MTIIIRVVTGAIQDADDNAYDRVMIVYVFLATGSLLVAWSLVLLGLRNGDIGLLQWTRKQRLERGEFINGRKEQFYKGDGERNKAISLTCFGSLMLLMVGAWAAYFWGVATGNNS